MNLSILIAALNEQNELNRTITSIRSTAPEAEIVVVDDCSSSPLTAPGATVIHNKHRIGVAASRQVAATYARGDHLLITDAHMRFDPGWYEVALARIADFRADTVFCARCCGFTGHHPDLVKPDGDYLGADFATFTPGPDRHVFDAVWIPKQRRPKDGDEIPCVMGAGYFISREWFYHIGGLRGLRYWGEDETLLSLKTWLAGGSVRALESIRVWHRFRRQGEKLPYLLKTWWKLYNKLFAIHTLVDERLAVHFDKLVIGGSDATLAREAIRADWNTVAIERARNLSIFMRDFEWFCAKFQIPLTV